MSMCRKSHKQSTHLCDCVFFMSLYHESSFARIRMSEWRLMRLMSLYHESSFTHSYTWRAPYICVIWLIYLCDLFCAYIIKFMPHIQTWQGPTLYSYDESIKSHVWIGPQQSVGSDGTKSGFRHSKERICHVAHVGGSFCTVNESRRTCEWIMSHMWLSHVTPVTKSYLTWD